MWLITKDSCYDGHGHACATIMGKKYVEAEKFLAHEAKENIEEKWRANLTYQFRFVLL